MIEERLLNVKQASEILGLKPKTLYQWKWLKSHLTFVKVGKALRIREEDLVKFIENSAIEPSKES